MNIYTSGPVCIDDLITVMGQFDPRDRWNGWLCPRIDALSAVLVLEAIENDPMNDGYYGYDWTFDDAGSLVIEDRQYRTEYPDDFKPEILSPDEDGLYSLGAYGWCWSEDIGW